MHQKERYQLDFNHYTPDEYRVSLAGDEEKVPRNWYDKTEMEKQQWLLKKLKQDTRFMNNDPHSPETVRKKMVGKLVEKRRKADPIFQTRSLI